MSPTHSFSLEGKRALVTGASRGIGAAVARSLAAAGARVVVTARRGPGLDATATSIESEYGVRTVALAASLEDAAGAERLAREAWDVFDGLDILVNNAGISIPQRVVDITAEAWDATMAINLRAPALLSARIGARMAVAGGGRIISIASTAGLRALSEHYAYSTSKAGLAMVTKSLAAELGPHGVRANTVSPTVIMTEMGERVWGEQKKAAPMLARIPVGHFGVPGDVAAAVVYLASPAADMVNGTELVVDGGYAAV